MQMDLQTEPVEVCPRWSAIQSKLPGSGSAVPHTAPAASAFLQGVIIRVRRHCGLTLKIRPQSSCTSSQCQIHSRRQRWAESLVSHSYHPELVS